MSSMCRICGQIDLTAAGAQSPDGKAAYVQINLAGNQGTTLGQDSVAAVRNIIAHNPPPPGMAAYVTGPSALLSDMQQAGDNSILKITAIGALIIFLVLLVVYRSVITVILLVGHGGDWSICCPWDRRISRR